MEMILIWSYWGGQEINRKRVKVTQRGDKMMLPDGALLTPGKTKRSGDYEWRLEYPAIQQNH